MPSMIGHRRTVTPAGVVSGSSVRGARAEKTPPARRARDTSERPCGRNASTTRGFRDPVASKGSPGAHCPRKSATGDRDRRAEHVGHVSAAGVRGPTSRTVSPRSRGRVGPISGSQDGTSGMAGQREGVGRPPNRNNGSGRRGKTPDREAGTSAHAIRGRGEGRCPRPAERAEGPRGGGFRRGCGGHAGEGLNVLPGGGPTGARGRQLPPTRARAGREPFEEELGGWWAAGAGGGRGGWSKPAFWCRVEDGDGVFCFDPGERGSC